MNRANKKQENTGLLIALFGTIFFHACLAAGLIYSSLSNPSMAVYDGDTSIQAVMIDLSMVAAPELSLVEDSVAAPDIKEVIVEEPQNDEPVEEAEEEPEEVIVEIEVESIIPVAEPIVKPEPKPKPQRQQQQPSTPRVRQEVDVTTRSDIAVASQISNNTHYSAIPKPVNRRDPVYPRRALDLRIEGSAVVFFDVDEKGRLQNIRITDAKPSNIFNRSIIQAMKQWRYEAKPAKGLSITFVFKDGRSTSSQSTE